MTRVERPETDDRLRRRPLGQQIADHLRSDILYGRITPTDVLTQESICERFGTSRIPVRDALQILVHQGFIESNGSRIRAVHLTRRDLEDMFFIEGALHALAVRFVTLRASASQIESLDSINDEMEQAQRDGDQERLATANFQFHQDINRMAESNRLLVALRSTSAKIHGNFLMKYPDHNAGFITEHRNLVAAMLARDADTASQLMFDHVGHAVDYLRRDPDEQVLREALSPD